MKTIPLPMGWQQIDAPILSSCDDGTPEEEWESTSNPRKPREEIICWARGNRYVRICKVLDKDEADKPYVVHAGWLIEPEEDQIKFYDCVSLEEAEVCARKLMRTGGY